MSKRPSNDMVTDDSPKREKLRSENNGERASRVKTGPTGENEVPRACGICRKQTDTTAISPDKVKKRLAEHHLDERLFEEVHDICPTCDAKYLNPEYPLIPPVDLRRNLLRGSSHHGKVAIRAVVVIGKYSEGAATEGIKRAITETSYASQDYNKPVRVLHDRVPDDRCVELCAMKAYRAKGAVVVLDTRIEPCIGTTTFWHELVALASAQHNLLKRPTVHVVSNASPETATQLLEQRGINLIVDSFGALDDLGTQLGEFGKIGHFVNFVFKEDEPGFSSTDVAGYLLKTDSECALAVQTGPTGENEVPRACGICRKQTDTTAISPDKVKKRLAEHHLDERLFEEVHDICPTCDAKYLNPEYPLIPLVDLRRNLLRGSSHHGKVAIRAVVVIGKYSEGAATEGIKRAITETSYASQDYNKPVRVLHDRVPDDRCVELCAMKAYRAKGAVVVLDTRIEPCIGTTTFWHELVALASAQHNLLKRPTVHVVSNASPETATQLLEQRGINLIVDSFGALDDLGTQLGEFGKIGHFVNFVFKEDEPGFSSTDVANYMVSDSDNGQNEEN